MATEMGAVILIDEARGRSIAHRDGLRTIGTTGTLLLAKQRKLVPAIKPLLERLRDETAFRITPAFLAEMVRLAGEE